VALGVACVCIGAVAFLVIAAPVELIRDRVVEQVEARTGRNLVVAGPVSLQLLPRPAVSLGEVSLSAADGDETSAAFVASRIDAELSLWSILAPQAAVERVTVHRPTIELGFDAQGRPLWSLAGPRRVRAGAADGPPPQKPQPASPPGLRTEPQAAPPLSRLGLVSLRVVDGTVRYHARDGEVTEAKALNLIVSPDGAGGALKLDGTTTVRDAPIAFSGTVDSLAALLAKQPSRLSMKISGPPFAGSYEGTLSITDGLSLDGSIRLESASAEALSRWAGRLVPMTTIGSGRLALAAKLQTSRERVSISELQASLGDGTVEGSLAVDTSRERRRVSGNLDFADLDFSKLIVKPRHAAAPAGATAPTASAPQATVPATAAPPAAQAPARPARERNWSEEPYNLAMLSALDADLAITARRITYRDLKTGAARLLLALDNSIAKVTLEHVELYGGRARGVLTLDGTGDVLVTGANLQLEGVSLQPLLSDALDLQWLEGRGRVSLAIAGQGLSERQIVEGLNGRAEMASADGAIVGLDVGKVVRSLQSARLPSLSTSPNERTPYQELAGTFTITNGIAHNDDLKLTGPHLQLNGEGKLNLGRRLVDYTVRTKVGGAPEPDATLKVGTIEVPVSITGPWDKPTFGIKGQEHLTGALKQIRKNLRSQEVRDAIKGLLEGDGEKRVKPRDLIDKFLKKE
jgi:AsmA protein